jgi:hypothetical protein
LKFRLPDRDAGGASPVELGEEFLHTIQAGGIALGAEPSIACGDPDPQLFLRRLEQGEVVCKKPGKRASALELDGEGFAHSERRRI